MIRTYLQTSQYEQLSNIRRWQIHAGSNHFCFNGHCITGRNLSGAIIILCLMSFTCIIWFIFELPVLMKEFNSIKILILIFGLLLIFYTYIYFFRSMCTDPGIIQRPSSIERTILKKHLNHLTYDIKINNVIVNCKYCTTCQMIRPPRSSHCAICSNCISILDHHCPFLSTCIGMRNYRFFILFLVFLLQTQLFLFSTSLIKVLSIIIYTHNQSFSQTILPLITSYFILMITIIGAIYTCNLLGYQCMISSCGLTTREDDKGIYINNNPFDTHSWLKNLARRFCTSLPPSAYGAHRLVNNNKTKRRIIKENI